MASDTTKSNPPRTDLDRQNDEEQEVVDRIGQSSTKAELSVDSTPEHLEKDDAPYSVFTPTQKKFIVAGGAIGAIFSPISTTIYLPALNTLAQELHVSNAKINLTVTTFLVRSLSVVPNSLFN